MCITAGLDPRWMTPPQTSDPKGVAHHQADELGYWLLCVPLGDEGIYQSFYSAGQDLRLCTCDLFEVIVPSAI